MSQTKVYILDLGVLECDEVWLASAPNPGTLGNPNPPANWLTIPTFAVLVEHPEMGRVLFDCGCSPQWKSRWPEGLQGVFPWTREVPLVEKLKELNLTPNDIDALILSHLHMDHAGNIDLFKGTKAGQNVYVHKKELEYAFYVTHIGPDPNVGAYVKADFSDIPGIVYKPVLEDGELSKGLEVVALPGHTPGVMGMVVHLEKEGTLIFTSDGIYSSKNYGPPANIPGLIYDSLGFVNTVEKVSRLKKQYNAKVIFGHDPEQFNALKLSPEFYE